MDQVILGMGNFKVLWVTVICASFPVSFLYVFYLSICVPNSYWWFLPKKKKFHIGGEEKRLVGDFKNKGICNIIFVLSDLFRTFFYIKQKIDLIFFLSVLFFLGVLH